MKESIKKLAAIITLSGLGLAGASSFAAEFEVLDRFSVDGYTVLRGSADIPGGFFTVGASSFAVKGGNVGIGTTGPGATLDVKAGAGNTYVVKVSSNDGTGLMVVKQNGNVGIGSANPDALLTVQAGSYPYPQIVMKGSGGGVMGYIQGIGNNLDLSSFMGAVTFSINGPEMARLANSGNFGIGTTNPDSRLQVAGGALHVGAYNAPQNIDIEGGVNFKILGNTISSIQRNWSDSLNGGLTLQYAQAGVLYDGLSLKTTGNVGIGTTNPGALLHVNGGSIYAQNNANSGNVAAALTSGAADVNGGHAGIGVNSYANAIDYNYGMTRIDAAKSAWLLTGRNANTANQANDFFSLKYSNVAGTTSEYLRIDAAGNIGIGTPAPTGKLSVYNSNGSDIDFLHLNSGTFPKVTAIGLGSDAVSYNYTSAGAALNVKGSAQIAAIQSAASNAPTDMAFYTTAGGNVVERLRISAGGNVGIGTTGPAATLDISGSMRLAPMAEPFTCSTTMKGSLYFNSSTNKHIMCNGTAWVDYTGPQGPQGPQGAQGAQGPQGPQGATYYPTNCGWTDWQCGNVACGSGFMAGVRIGTPGTMGCGSEPPVELYCCQ